MEDRAETTDATDLEKLETPETDEVGLDSVALSRLLDEVRNSDGFQTSGYNRTYNRHNR